MDDKVGGAASWEFRKLLTRIPDGASIFSAEAVALIDALKLVRSSTLKKFIIFTDSLSCLQSIENEDLSNPLIMKFLLKYKNILLQGKTLVLCWIPSHVGIPGNEKADRLAKESLEEEIRPIPMPYTDFMGIPKRSYCDECSVPLTVRHIMSECAKYQDQREMILPGESIREIFSHSDKDIIAFLRECNLLHQL